MNRLDLNWIQILVTITCLGCDTPVMLYYGSLWDMPTGLVCGVCADKMGIPILNPELEN